MNIINTNITDSINTIKYNLGNVAAKITSGSKIPTIADFIDLDNSDEVPVLQDRIAANGGYIKMGGSAIDRIGEIDLRLENIINVAQKAIANMSNAGGASSNVLQFADAANYLLAQIQTELNSTDANGNYIFGGGLEKSINGKSSNPPTDLTKSNLINNQPSNNYYSGGANLSSVRVSDNSEIVYGITANESSFQNIIGSLNLFVKAVTDGGQSGKDLLKTAMDLAQDATEDLIGLREILGQKTVIIEFHNDANTKANEIFNNSLANSTKVTPGDLAELETLMINYYATLNAAYMNIELEQKNKL